jgi:hypothetical protein
VLDERRAFVGHAGDGLLISCEKLHMQTSKRTKHLLRRLRNVVSVRKLQTAVMELGTIASSAAARMPNAN